MRSFPDTQKKSELIKRIESKDPHHLMPQSPQGEAKAHEAGGDCGPEGVGEGGRGLSATLGV